MQGSIRPYFAAGAVVRYIGPIRARGELLTRDLATGAVVRTAVDTGDLPELRKRAYTGVTIAGGIELGAGRVRLLPEVRIVRWTANIEVPGRALRFAPTQAELLLGFLF